MQCDSLVMSVVGAAVLAGLGWWLLRTQPLGGLISASASVAFALIVLITGAATRACLTARRRSRYRRADTVVGLMAQVATACEDLDPVLRAEGGRMRTETVARVSSRLATANELLSRSALVANRASWLRRCQGAAEHVFAQFAAVRARVASEVSIGKVVQ